MVLYGIVSVIIVSPGPLVCPGDKEVATNIFLSSAYAYVHMCIYIYIYIYIVYVNMYIEEGYCNAAA